MNDAALRPWARFRAVVVSVAGAVLLMAFGVGVAVLAVEQGSLGLMIFGLMMLGIGLVTAGTLGTMLVFRRQLAAESTAPQRTFLDGEPATYLPRPSFLPHLSWPQMAVIGLACLGWGATLRPFADNWLLAGLLLLAGAWMLTLPVWVAQGRVSAGGIWLTPTRVVQRWGTAWWSVRYDDILKVSYCPDGVGIKATDWEQRFLAPTFRNRHAIPRFPQRRRHYQLALQHSTTCLDQFTLTFLIEELLKDPRARLEAGTDDINARIDRLREASRESAAYRVLSRAERADHDRKREEKFQRFVAEMEARFAAEAAAAPEAEARKDVTSSGPE